MEEFVAADAQELAVKRAKKLGKALAKQSPQERDDYLKRAVRYATEYGYFRIYSKYH